MSSMIYLAADVPMETVKNPHYKMFSVNEALDFGITDIPEFMLEPDFDKDKPNVICWSDIEMEIDTENDYVRIDDFDDDLAIFPFDEGLFCQLFTEKKYRMQLEWGRYSEGRAKLLIEYIKRCLATTDEVEIWHLWLGEESYVLPKKQRVSVLELAPEHIERLEEFAVHNEPCRQYCLVVKR
ncbi:MAG: hypothetical protein IJF27_09070 [Oscillospiraceae bacterium]|nr:hypothetical protein [Oscillospiraceae bacterium]MBQ3049405.1 hypothetical protein [Oscillospiraceae bacterium]MBQ9939564.1 hypothetical protein [Oscillospiraceae bacterium]